MTPEKQEARTPRGGLLVRIFSLERRYADLGYLLPMFPIGPAVKTRCIGSPTWLASLVQSSTISKNWLFPGWRGTTSANFLATVNAPPTCRFVLLRHPTCHSPCLPILAWAAKVRWSSSPSQTPNTWNRGQCWLGSHLSGQLSEELRQYRQCLGVLLPKKTKKPA